MKNYITVLSVLLLAGCAAPGAPTIRTDPNDGRGPLVADCINILPPTQLTTYDTVFYRSTWSSVWVESAQSELRQGMSSDEDEKKWVRFKKKFAYDVMMSTFGLDGRRYPFPPYCTTFSTSTEAVDTALNSILPILGNTILASDKRTGLYGTEFMNREHPGAKWRDRYIITVHRSTSKLAVVTVFRELYISRGGAAFEMAMSDGHNETWILAQIAEEIGVPVGGQ